MDTRLLVAITRTRLATTRNLVVSVVEFSLALALRLQQTLRFLIFQKWANNFQYASRICYWRSVLKPLPECQCFSWGRKNPGAVVNEYAEKN